MSEVNAFTVEPKFISVVGKCVRVESSSSIAVESEMATVEGTCVKEYTTKVNSCSAALAVKKH